MGDAQVSLLQLATAGFALHLLVNLVDHADAAGADGMAEAFEAAVGVNRQVTLQRERPVRNVGAGLARGLKPRSSMMISSVMVKQSCTIAMSISARGSVMPASS